MNKYYTITKNEKEKIQKEIIRYLKNKKEIIFVYLHGSFLKDKFRDIDIAIYLDADFTEKKALKYELFLEDELSNKLSYPCDIRILNHTPLSFRFSVIKKGILLFSKNENKRVNFECLSLVKYHDFNFYRKRYLREALGIKV
jgi:uncharacterized protein